MIWAALVLGLAAADLPSTPMSGTIPAGVGAVLRVVWIAFDGADVRLCSVSERRWLCDVPGSGRGVVLIVGDAAVASRIVDSPGPDSGNAVHRRGRLVFVSAGGVAPDDLRDLHARAWKPERSAGRRRSLRPRRRPSRSGRSHRSRSG